ncbi:LysM domain protein [Akanthomyces lecanii RCEF 1005]|uniref:LysM domain protein n=1 Tax=Akanthomyces lecanii RCEF 1005 TaxID=1081108 RepID=A0A168HY26_CORDF|nr:LysM domain protein [Akanthomyces lecanii RCEF 1005]
MAPILYAGAILSALVAVHRLFQFHAVHSLFVSCASRTNTRHQTRFESSERYLISGEAARASERPGLVTFEFEEDGDGLLIQVPVGSWWRTVTARHRTQVMCREVDLISGDWAIRGFYASIPLRGPPEKPNLWYDIQVMVKFVDIDADSSIHTGHRFCEPGVKLTLNTADGQKTVAFFYPDVWDDIPSSDEQFFMPPKKESQAPDKWSISVQSSTCNDTEDSNQPLRPMLCSAAKEVANGTLTTKDIDHAAGEGSSSAVKNSDGSVTITDFSVAYLKMLHPKTRANWYIAQAVFKALSFNLN